MKYFISTGEASGELHASVLIASLKEKDPLAEFIFLGGENMIAASGNAPLIHIHEMSVMGFGEVIRKLPEIVGHLKKVKKTISEWKPDAVILVDYPSFNLKIAKFAKRLGIPVFWYISPKVWVWKEWRVKTMKKYIDRLYSILPFEVDYFRDKHNWDVNYVGNPSVEEINHRLGTLKKVSAEEFKKIHGIPADRPILALVPGSRVKEIKSNLPIMVGVAKNFPDYFPVITAMSDVPSSLYDELAPGFKRLTRETLDVISHSDAALVTSGTATLETALVGIPQVMLYRHNGSRLEYLLGRGLLKVPYFSLPNLINDNETIPELVMHFCTPESVTAKLADLINNEDVRKKQQDDYRKLRERLGNSTASRNAAEDVVEFLARRHMNRNFNA